MRFFFLFYPLSSTYKNNTYNAFSITIYPTLKFAEGPNPICVCRVQPGQVVITSQGWHRGWISTFTFTSTNNLQLTNFPFFVCERKLEWLERTDASTGRTCNLHTESPRRISPRTFSLWFNSASQSTTWQLLRAVPLLTTKGTQWVLCSLLCCHP